VRTFFTAIEFNIVGAHQFARRDIDQPVPEHVAAQQHLTLTALEPPQVNLVGGQ
jgi:hypothetical protein